MPAARTALALLALAAAAVPIPAIEERSTRQMLQAGAIAIEEGDFQAAESQFRGAADLDPRLPQAHFGLALAALGRHDRRAAERALRAAEQLAPSQPEVRYAIGVTAFAFDDGRTAEIEFRAAADADPAFLEARYALGIAAGLRGDLVAAESALRAALRLDPLHPPSHYQLGAVLARGGNVDGALAELSRALARTPSLAEARAEDPLGFAERRVPPPVPSGTLGLPLPVLRPSLAWAQRRPGPAAGTPTAADIPDWFLYYETALQLEDAGQYAGEVERLQKALAIKDRSEALAVVADRLVDYSPHLHMTIAMHRLGNFREAFLHLGIAKNEGNASPEALRALGVLVQKDRLRPRIYLDALPDRTTDEAITVRGVILADEAVQRVEISGREAVLRQATPQEVDDRSPEGDKWTGRDAGQGMLFEVTGQRLALGTNVVTVRPYFRNPARDGDLVEAHVVRLPPPAPEPAPAPKPAPPAKPATPRGGTTAKPARPKPPGAP
jgi:tetratricopeptide (TPR) repeat protein